MKIQLNLKSLLRDFSGAFIGLCFLRARTVTLLFIPMPKNDRKCVVYAACIPKRDMVYGIFQPGGSAFAKHPLGEA